MLSGKRAKSRQLTASHEHYLRSIWKVRAQRGYARLADVARELGVSPPTVSVGIRPLEARKLVTHDDHRFLLLTPAGERVAREVHHRFAVVHVFLRDVLGIAEGAALDQACVLEHGVSGATAERLLDLMKLLRADRPLREMFQRRFAAYHRDCVPAESCSTCDLACMGDLRSPA
jgi:Mn-dependent DtxR family transcriptional regulator